MKLRSTILNLLLVTSVGLLYAHPLSKPLEVFESTKIPRRTMKDGPSIFGTLPEFNEANATPEQKAQYRKMVQEVKDHEKRNEKYRHNKALLVFESTKIHSDRKHPSALRKSLSKVFSAVGLGSKDAKKSQDKNTSVKKSKNKSLKKSPKSTKKITKVSKNDIKKSKGSTKK